jgi:two-component system LytT family response regulator
MIRMLLVDDEELARSTMRRALAAIPDIEIAGEAGNGVEAIETIAELRPDAVLLDIEMPGFNGFEVVQQLANPPIIVFVTAYDEYAVRAFDANAIDYLLKPVQPERLEKTLARVRERLAARAPEQNKGVAEIARQRGGPIRRLAARRGKRIAIVPLREVNRIEIEDKLVFACTPTERLLIEKTIGTLPMWPIALALSVAGIEIRVRTEDGLLRGRFGDQFEAWRGKVPAYIPFVR